MSYLVQRQDRFNVVAYDGLDPLPAVNADDGIRWATIATKPNNDAWFVDRYINAAVGDIPVRRLRADHLDTLYDPNAAR